MKKRMFVVAALLSVSAFLITGVPSLVASCYFTVSTANYVVDVINAWGTASFAISLVLAATGAGASVASLVAAIATYISKKGTAKAVSW